MAELEHEQESGITTGLIAEQFYFMKHGLNSCLANNGYQYIFADG